MITVSLNGNIISTDKKNLSDAMAEWDYAEKKCAVAINGEFIPRSRYRSHALHNNDEVDVVAPVGGG